MDLGLNGSVAVVTGGAKGIGAAIAREFASEGADVAVLDLEDCHEFASELSKDHDVRTIGVRCDITDFDALKRTVDLVEGTLGPVRSVVHAAATGSGKFGFPFLNLEPSDWRRVLEVNVEGAVNVAHAFAPGLRERRAGSFVFLSSVAALFGSQTDPPYSASKAALLNFAQCMARDLAADGIRVNSICPGMVRTELNRSVWQAWHDQQPPEVRLSYDEWANSKVEGVVPLGRWQQPEDIAAMAIFLASSRANNVTGQTVGVDGGYVMR